MAIATYHKKCLSQHHMATLSSMLASNNGGGRGNALIDIKEDTFTN